MIGRVWTIPIHPLCPTHLRKCLSKLVRLEAWGNGLRGVYHVPIWLVGSALHDDNDDPRDWDVRVVLPRRDFEMRFGPIDDWSASAVTGAWTRTRDRGTTSA